MTPIDKTFSRHAQPLVLDALANTRVVFIAGARQVGKSTLAQAIVAEGHPTQELSLDDRATREVAHTLAKTRDS